MRHSYSEQIHIEWTNISEKKYSLRSIMNKDLKVLENDSNEGNRKPKYLQNYDKRLDMEKHPFILIITHYTLFHTL